MKTILLVEDDKQLALGIEYTLKSESFNVLRAEGVAESISVFDSSNKIDLILLDLTLPDGTGYDFCKYVREKSKIPIIFLTAMDEEVNAVLAFDLGGDDYITKPIRIREFISRINAVLRRTASQEEVSNTKKSGDLLLNMNKAQLYKNHQEILITSVEYKILVHFMNNPQQVVTRESITNTLWDCSGEYVDNNTLSVYIRRIREKIEDSPSKPEYIKTIRGLGYKWNKNIIK